MFENTEEKRWMTWFRKKERSVRKILKKMKSGKTMSPDNRPVEEKFSRGDRRVSDC